MSAPDIETIGCSSSVARRASRSCQGRGLRAAFLVAGGVNVATTLRREVIATDSPRRMSLRTSGNALRICRTVAVFMSHQFVSRTQVVKMHPLLMPESLHHRPTNGLIMMDTKTDTKKVRIGS